MISMFTGDCVATAGAETLPSSGAWAAEYGWVGLVRPGVCIPFDSIRSAGAYICNWSGHLLRVPSASLIPNTVMNIIGPEPLYVTKISDDPDVPIHKARQLARSLELQPTF